MVTELVGNIFRVGLSRNEFDFPYLDSPSWQDSTRTLRDSLARYRAYRYKLPNEQIRIIVFDGPDLLSNYQTTKFNLEEMPYLGTRLIEHSVARYLHNKGMRTEHTGFGLFAQPSTPNYSKAGIDVTCGISLSARRPFREKSTDFVVTAKWEVRANFSASLGNDSMRQMAEGMPVLYRPVQNSPVEMRRFEDNF